MCSKGLGEIFVWIDVMKRQLSGLANVLRRSVEPAAHLRHLECPIFGVL